MLTFVICLVLLVAAYFTYGRYLDRVCKINPNASVPSTELYDGVDYVPMPRWRTFLIQLLNIAGTGPIFGAILGVKTVPELWKGFVYDEKQLKELVDKFVNMPSVYGDTREGVVIRLTNSFPIDDFKHCVCKWVRPNHVQTDEHWTKNWKKAELINK